MPQKQIHESRIMAFLLYTRIKQANFRPNNVIFCTGGICLHGAWMQKKNSALPRQPNNTSTSSTSSSAAGVGVDRSNVQQNLLIVDKTIIVMVVGGGGHEHRREEETPTKKTKIPV